MPDTNVLITRFMDGGSVLEITDFMPVMAEDGPVSAIMRRVACVTGDVDGRDALLTALRLRPRRPART